jgi:hypothetical protein
MDDRGLVALLKLLDRRDQLLADMLDEVLAAELGLQRLSSVGACCANNLLMIAEN